MAWLDRHRELTDDLAQSLRELGDLRGQVTLASRDIWLESDHLNVTERRETVRYALAEFHAEVSKLEMEVEALRVELAHVDQRLKLGVILRPPEAVTDG